MIMPEHDQQKDNREYDGKTVWHSRPHDQNSVQCFGLFYGTATAVERVIIAATTDFVFIYISFSPKTVSDIDLAQYEQAMSRQIDVSASVRYWPKADIDECTTHVCF